MPLPNRVNPFGELFADPARGRFLGNRGGRFHTDQRSLTSRRWVSRAWICCRLEFNQRHRRVWGNSYTELFFLDEPTAFAAGHRPCFECRRRDATTFAELFAQRRTLGTRSRAADMDRILHAERLSGKVKRLHHRDTDDLPDGAFVTLDGSEPLAVRGNRLLRWTPAGYGSSLRRMRKPVNVLTPPSILAVLAAGYRPVWHPSALAIPSSPP